MAGAPHTSADVDVDLGTLFASIRRDWLLIAGVALAVTGLAVAVAWLSTPHYRAETRILIETRESVFTRPNATGEADRPILDEEGLTSQVEVIGSTDLLKQVAKKLDLASLDEFDQAAEMSSVGRFLVLLGLKSDPGEIPPEERVLTTMREKLKVYRVERSRVIVIEFSSEDPRLAAEVPNAMAEAYLELQRAAKLQSNADATEWLEPEIADLRERVKQAEARVADFRAQSDLLLGQNNSALATQQLSEMSSELSRVRAARSAADAKAQSLREALSNGASLDSLPDVLSSPLVQRLRERQVQLNTDIADLSTTLLENHPRIKSLRSQLADLDGQIREEARNILRGLETEVSTSRLREQKLTADLNVVKAESARVGDEEVELRALEREAASQRALLESYLTRYREAASRADRAYLPVDARVFSRAIAPSQPYFPKIMPIAGAAFVGSLLVMAIVTLLRELFSGRALREREVYRPLPVEQIAMPAPTATDAPARPQPEAPSMPPPAKRAPVAPNDNRLTASSAADRIIASGASRAVFVSPEGDEAAASAVMVARETADAGLRVLLLDLTYAGAASSAMLDGERLPGITDLLASEAQFSDVIHGDRYSECHVIPSGTADPARAMRAADRLPIIMESLTTAYDVVVVECGPADVDGIGRLVADGTQVFLSALEPYDEAIEAVARELEEGGYRDLLMVKPEGIEPPVGPMPDRTAA